ncbi:MAG: antitoxin [Deltaproteobacteria bacterium]|nr:antitoxin [Deltaproteobacteria bacterium]
MKSITIRGIELSSVADRLKTEAGREGKSVNQFIKDIIKTHLGMGMGKRHSAVYHDLDHLFAKWSEADFLQIQGKIDRQRRIDEELWA